MGLHGDSQRRESYCSAAQISSRTAERSRPVAFLWPRPCTPTHNASQVSIQIISTHSEHATLELDVVLQFAFLAVSTAAPAGFRASSFGPIHLGWLESSAM